jgi:hypothetical protein
MPSGTWYRVAVVRTDVSDKVSSLSSGFFRVIGFYNCVTVERKLWNSITLRSPEDGDDTFSETSVSTRATRYEVPGGIYNNVLILFKIKQ